MISCMIKNVCGHLNCPLEQGIISNQTGTRNNEEEQKIVNFMKYYILGDMLKESTNHKHLLFIMHLKFSALNTSYSVANVQTV